MDEDSCGGVAGVIAIVVVLTLLVFATGVLVGVAASP